MPRVSVVLPVRNAASTLREAVASIVDQTWTDWELLLIDDRSNDGSLELAECFAAADRRIRLLRNPGAGIVDALNFGLASSSGEYVARMDADDVSAPDRLAAEIAWLDCHPEAGLVSCLVKFGGSAERAAGYALHVQWINALVEEDSIASQRFIESPFAHPSVCFRRELVARHGGYREGPFPEDYDLWLRWLDAGVRMGKVPEVLFEWRDLPGRLSRSHPRYSPEAFFRVKAPYLVAHVQRLFRQQGRERSLWVWGAGRPTRKRAQPLTEAGARIAGYIDIDPRKVGRFLEGPGVPVISADRLPDPRENFVLVYVANRGARDLIRARLASAQFIEGKDYLVCA